MSRTWTWTALEKDSSPSWMSQATRQTTKMSNMKKLKLGRWSLKKNLSRPRNIRDLQKVFGKRNIEVRWAPWNVSPSFEGPCMDQTRGLPGELSPKWKSDFGVSLVGRSSTSWPNCSCTGKRNINTWRLHVMFSCLFVCLSVCLFVCLFVCLVCWVCIVASGRVKISKTLY